MRVVDKQVHLSFKDILLVPYDETVCTIMSRNDPDISTHFCEGRRIDIPLISSPMDSVSEPRMVSSLNNLGSLGVQTRYINDSDEISKQIAAVKKIKEESQKGHVACAIGVKGDVYHHAMSLCDVGLDVIFIDIANGNHVLMLKAIETVQRVRDKHPFLSIVVGNVATGCAASNLVSRGIEAIRVGIGSGASCLTRRVLGMGVPQFSAIMDVYEHIHGKVRIISDGGCRNSGDVIKSLWAGADAVMSGWLFAGHEECPEFAGGQKMYRGMASRTVSGRSDVAPEGICMEVPNKGSVKNTVLDLAAAIRAACSMANANNLEEFRRNVRAIRVSTMSNEESDPIQI